MEEAGNAPTYISKHKKIFIHFAKMAISKELLNEKALRGNSFNPSTKNTEYINLSEAEIQKIYEVTVKEKSLEGKAKDIFLLCCYTGQNFIDVAEIKESDIVRDGDRHYWIVHRKKTEKRVPILLNPKALEILKKREFKLNNLISIQQLNKKIKLLGKKAGITDKVTLIKGNEPVTKEKWEFIVSHTGRRSFLNIMYDYGMKERQIMQFSTHGSVTTLETYLNVSEKEIKKKMLEIGFLN
jgi:integrase